MAAQRDSTNLNPLVAQVGMNLNSSANAIANGELTFAWNAVVENFDGQRVNYSNEPANEFCCTFPTGYKVNGSRNIIEDGLIVVWLVNPSTGDSEIGMVKDCVYEKKINAKCIGLNVDAPILKTAHQKNGCSLQVFWVASNNKPRYIDFDNLPFKQTVDGCEIVTSDEIDCNKLNIQPDFDIPEIEINSIIPGGNTKAGTYQFAAQYANSLREPYTSYYSVTNPVSLFDIDKITQDFDYPVDKSISLTISNIDRTGLYDYINLAVIRTINNIPTEELVGSYEITSDTLNITYSGQSLQSLSPGDIFVKYEIYERAEDLTTAQDVLILDQLTTAERLSYQEIANQITLKWQSHRIKGDKPYAKEKNVVDFKGYMRGEVYALEIVPLLKSGKQADGFTIPSRKAIASDLISTSNADTNNEILPRWKVYNTATSSVPVSTASDYEGPYQQGEFSYWESLETYPCNDIYGDLQNVPIRHHKFPDNSISPHFDEEGYIYPIGIRIDVQQVVELIANSTLTNEQKEDIQGFKIVRGNRATNKSIIAKGIVDNVLKYSTSTSGSDSSQNTIDESIDNLIDSAISNLRTTIDTLSLFRGDAKEELGDAIEDLELAKTLDPTSEEFNTAVQSALDSVHDVQSRGALDNKTEAYLEIDESLIQAILDTSESYAQLDTSIIEDQGNTNTFYFPNYLFNDVSGDDSLLEGVIYDDSSKSRFTFHSPDTHFYQPSLGDRLTLEGIISGASSGHIQQVKNHSRYQFVNSQAYLTALLGGVGVGFLSATIGVSTNVFNGTAAFTAYQALLEIIYKLTPHKNYAYQFNAVGNYNKFLGIENNGEKSRELLLGYYLAPGMFNTGDDYVVNNYQRESSVYLKTDSSLPYTNEANPSSSDKSKLIYPTDSEIFTPISSYYTSIKNSVPNQYGQIYSYETIDTGYQKMIDISLNTYVPETIFGGDIFINKFAFKKKFPLFIDNRVAVKGTTPIDDADISYNEIGNIGRPKYWFSTDVTESKGILGAFFGIKEHNFFWSNPTFFYDNGRIFLFAYGIPNFYCESEVNVDLRQAYNDREGDFFPHVSNHIPDEWLQEYHVSINHDNTYFYNKTFSKQNKENFFTHLPPDFTMDECTQSFPYRAIFSEARTDNPNPYRRNNWLIFKPAGRFDFPQNYGKLISLDGTNSQQVFARFENKTLLYNAQLTIPTSVGEAYLGKGLFSQNVPPLDLADTDLGYIGTQHKFILKTEYGTITTDAKRGQVFILNGKSYEELSSDKYKCQQFFAQHLPFSILKHYPTLNIDNHYKDIGLHGVYDARFNRMILSKLDYELIDPVNRCFDGTYWRDTTVKKQIIDARVAQGYELQSFENCKLTFTKKLTQSVLPKDTDVYAFFDATSMIVSDGVVAAEALTEWFVTLKAENPLFNGALYIIPTSIEPPPRDEAEQYLQYLSRVYNGDPFMSYDDPDWNDIKILPTGFGEAGWAPKRNIILLAFVDEAQPSYHTTVVNSFGGQPTASYISDYEDFIATKSNFDFFRGVLYPIVRMDSATSQACILQVLAAVEGTTLTSQEITALGTPVDVSLIQTTNPYEGYELPDESTMIPLKFLGWKGIYNKVSPASEVFDSETFAAELTSLLDLSTFSSKTLTVVDELPIITIGDPKYFLNKSFTISFDFENMRWISFHSYNPNFYIGDAHGFYSGVADGMYKHQTVYTQFNKFYDQVEDYIIEYPQAYKYRDELLQSVQDYTKVLKYNDYQEFVETDDIYFDEIILYNNQQCSGVLKLQPKPKGSINQYLKYPLYNIDSKTITFTKSNNFYQYNTFWSLIKDKGQPIWKTSKMSPFKELNQDNMNYKKLTYQKAPLVSKDLKIRNILNSTSDYKLISQLAVTLTKQQF